MTEIILIIVLALLSSWEEINELYRDGSWKRDMFYPFLFWETKPSEIYTINRTKVWLLRKWIALKKLLDSKHVSFGAFVLVMCIILRFWEFPFNIFECSQTLNTIAQVIALWVFLFYIRNLGMHIILRRKSFRQWKYLLPINF